MYLERAYRQVTLVSYGNEYLKDSVDSEIIDRHPLLFTHFPILRDLEKGTLLAGSASHILNHLKEQGLYKISLHFTSDVSQQLADSQIFNFNDQDLSFCIVCHFQNQKFKALISVEEKPIWQEYDANQFPTQSNYNNYHNSVENYVLINVSNEFHDKILVDLQPFSWKSFYNEYQNRVYAFEISQRYGTFPVPLTESNCYEGDLYQKEEQFPLLPFNLKRNYASNLIINAATITKSFKAESHAKNEYAEYWHMSANDKSNFSQAWQTVDEFFPTLLKHSANHYQDASLNLQAPQHSSLISISKTIDEPQNNSLSNLNNNEFITGDTTTDEADKTSSTFKWFGLIKFLWWILWCYCSLWALAYFAVRWGNIFIIIIALFYALYKALKIKDDQSI